MAASLPGAAFFVQEVTVERKSSISQLDLLLLGRRGITSRIAGVERTVRELVLGQGSRAGEDDGLIRPNLLLNSSFEFYNRNAVGPNDWSISGAAVLAFGVAGADGSTAISCGPGATLSQTVAGGLTQPKSSAVLSVAAKANNYGAKVVLSASHTPGLVLGPIYRIDPDGNEAQTDVVPGDGEWYRFWRPILVNGGDTLLAVIGSDGNSTATLFLDAAKYEKEDNSASFIEPSAYIGGDWGASVHLRNLSADNIIAGTLTVGGSSSDNPRISVKDGNDVEIITIGDPNGGFYGIDVMQDAGIRVSGSGSIEITGTGDLNVSGGGNINVSGDGNINITDDGDLNVSGTGSINVSGGGDIRVTGGGSVVVDGGLVNVVGTGAIRAGTTGAQRIDITESGIAGYNNANTEQVRLDSADGKLRVLGPGAVSVEGGGSMIAGTPGAARVELNSGGIYAYNDQNEETVGLSTADGTLTIDADALIVEGTAVFDAITVEGAVTIMQDLTLGANVLFVDTSGQRVGINRAPDAQFDLDVNGSIRAGGYIVGKHALQLADALLIAHYDGAGVVGANLTGDPTGHRGQVATITGSVSYPAGKFNKGLQLAEGATVSYAATGNISAADGSISVWARYTGTGEQTILAWGSASPNWVTLGVNASGQVFACYGSGTLTGTEVMANTWHHFALTWSGGTVRLYLNGAEVGTALTGVATPSPDTALFVGTSTGGTNRWQGVIDDLAILGVAAEAGLVRAIFESGAPVFAETSSWGFRTANTLAWADEEGLWARSATGAEAFAVSGVNGKSWGNIGQNLDAGDVLIGNTTSYAWWDASAATLKIKGTLDASTITGSSITGGVITGASISGGVITGSSISGGTITGATIRTSDSGARVELSSATNGGLIGYSASDAYDPATGTGTYQILWKKSDGTFWFGNGKGWLSADGLGFVSREVPPEELLDFEAAPERARAVNFVAENNPSALLGSILGWFGTPEGTTNRNYIDIIARHVQGRPGAIRLKTYTDSANTNPQILEIDEYGFRFAPATGGAFFGCNVTISGDTYSSVLRNWYGSAMVSGTDNWLRLNAANQFSSGVYTPGHLRVDGNLYVGSVQYFYADYGGIATKGPLVAGSTGINYWPNSSTWNSGGATLVLNGDDYSSIAFHDASSRVDAIIAGGGTIRIGTDIGWGTANTEIAGALNAYGNTRLWGRVAINTSVWSGAALMVDGFDDGASNFSFISRRNNDSNLFYSRNDGYLWAHQAWAIGSDVSLKENIQDLPTERARMKRVRFRKFKRKLSGAEDIGVVAQELREVYPELVTEVHHPLEPEGKTELAVNYTGLAVLQGKALQELDDEVDQLRRQMRRQLETLEAKVAALEARLGPKQK